MNSERILVDMLDSAMGAKCELFIPPPAAAVIRMVTGIALSASAYAAYSWSPFGEYQPLPALGHNSHCTILFMNLSNSSFGH